MSTPKKSRPIEIVVRQMYGLGNQLFQYAVGRYFAKKYQASLRIAVELPTKLFSYGLPRPFLLNKFNIVAPTGQLTTFERLLLSTSPRLELPTRPYRSLFGIEIIREGHPQKHVFDLNMSLARNTRIAYFVGLWQCYPQVQVLEDELRVELSFREPPAGKNSQVARLIQSTPNAISIHMRRGDFVLDSPNVVLPIEYYRKALEHMRTRLETPTFFIFSDEPKFAHELAATNPDCRVVDHNGGESAHEDMRLMSLCRHHIVANSTFSWWGAWLNPRKDKTVVVPRRWLHYDINTIQIALPGWTIL